jgi:hypothetical protein
MYVYYWHEPVHGVPVKSRLVAQVRQVEVTDQLATGGDYDYADAYEVRLPEPDLVTPESWVRSGMDDAPAVVEWIADRLGLGDETSTSDDEIDGGRVVESNADVVHIEWSLPLMRVVVVGRKIGPSDRRLTSFLYYKRPVLARLVWAVVGIGHRRMARRLITSTISSPIEG